MLNVSNKQMHSQMQSASERNHSVANLFRALEPNVVCGQYATVVQQCHERAMYSNTLWAMATRQQIISFGKTIYTVKDLENRSMEAILDAHVQSMTRTQCKSAKLLHSLFQSRLYINAIHRLLAPFVK